jgi:hypothetical protein
VHLLNGESSQAVAELRRLEVSVGALFGVQLARSAGSPDE